MVHFNTRHGCCRKGLRTHEYVIWGQMKARCYNPKNDSYKYYGGRGIKVCGRWLGSDGFINFLADLGQCPTGYSIDRIDNNGDYEPNNCRWATRSQQAKNQRRLRLTFCKRGHELTEDNVVVHSKTKKRSCRECVNFRERRRYHKARGHVLDVIP